MSGARLDRVTLRIPTVVRRRPALVHAATDVSLDLAPGRLHALVGESGCGKSIIASTLTGLLPPGTQVRGSVTVAGRDVTGLLGRPRHRTWSMLRGRVVGSIPQSPATAFTPTRTIGAQLRETITAVGGTRTLDDLLELARLPRQALAAYPHELSGGLLSRAAIAGALAGAPAVVVADEPTSSLDAALARDILALLRREADAGAAVILITHDVAALLDAEVADDVSVMYAGRIVDHGTGDLWAQSAHPYTGALLRALPRHGLNPVPGDPPALTDLDDTLRFEDRLMGHP